MSEHTPERWKVFIDGTTGSLLYMVLSDTRISAVAINIKTVEDANLIAAAPQMAEDNKRLRELNAELLEALKELLQYIDDHDWGTIPEGVTADRARAVIAKATGGK